MRLLPAGDGRAQRRYGRLCARRRPTDSEKGAEHQEFFDHSFDRTVHSRVPAQCLK